MLQSYKAVLAFFFLNRLYFGIPSMKREVFSNGLFACNITMQVIVLRCRIVEVSSVLIIVHGPLSHVGIAIIYNCDLAIDIEHYDSSPRQCDNGTLREGSILMPRA